MNTKICTDIEQSKKLIELGLDKNTADMYWDASLETPLSFCLNYNAEDRDYDKMQKHNLIIAWSLTALLIILSEAAFDYDDDGGISLFSLEKKWHSNMLDCPVEYGKEYDEPIDSVFEMVCRALKDDIIKNKKI